MKLVGAFFGGAVGALLVAVAVLYVADLEVTERGSSDSDSSLVSVPNVLGQATSDAVDELRGADLGATVESRSDLPPWAQGGGSAYDEVFGDGDGSSGATVRTQNPDPGTDVAPGTDVTISVE